MPELNPEIQKKFDELFKEAIKLSPEYQLLEDNVVPGDKKDPNYTSFESKIESMVWQAFIFGLRVSREHEEIFRVTCAHCSDWIIETAKGEIVIYSHLAEGEGWVWNFDDQNWSCPDCAKND